MRWLIALLVIVAMGFTSPLAAQAPYDDENTAEGWAWARIKRDEIAN